MSFDVHVQRFVDGEPADATSAQLRDLIAPHVARREPNFDFAELHFDDGTADLYGIDNPGGGFMVNHVGGESAWHLVAAVAAAGSMTIIAPGVPAMIVSEAMRVDLPDDLAGDAVVVVTGADVLRTILAA